MEEVKETTVNEILDRWRLYGADLERVKRVRQARRVEHFTEEMKVRRRITRGRQIQIRTARKV